MKVCSICGENNEDWMNICQRCGCSIEHSNEVQDVYKPKKNKFINPYEENDNSYSYETNNNYNYNEKRSTDNLGLKIILIILLIILICLIGYTLYTIF